MPSDTIVDSQLYIRLDFDISLKDNSIFQTNPINRAYLANQLLLYDCVVIPTKDFGVIPILISWMGLKIFREALESRAIAFLRPKSLLGYAGNGNGISGFNILPSVKRTFKWWQEAIFGPIESGPDLQLKYQCPFISKKERVKLVELILKYTKPLEYDNDCFMENIVNESCTDIMSDSRLKAFILRQEPSKKEIDLARLSGINPDQFRVLNLASIRDSIDLVLRVADINMEILMAYLYGQADIGTSEGADYLLKNKLLRGGATPSMADKFLSLLELNNIPDIRPAIESGELSLPEIWRLRKKRLSKKFRKWLRCSSPSDSRELEKAYVSALGSSSVFDSLPFKIIRFGITAAIGLSSNIAGLISSSVNSFFIQKWLQGYSPKVFLDKLGKLPH